MAQNITMTVTDAMATELQARATALGITPGQYILRRLREVVIAEKQAIFEVAQEKIRVAAVQSGAATAQTNADTANAANLTTLNGSL